MNFKLLINYAGKQRGKYHVWMYIWRMSQGSDTSLFCSIVSLIFVACRGRRPVIYPDIFLLLKHL